jgi:hypothetical protein
MYWHENARNVEQRLTLVIFCRIQACDEVGPLLSMSCIADPAAAGRND